MDESGEKRLDAKIVAMSLLVGSVGCVAADRVRVVVSPSERSDSVCKVEVQVDQRRLWSDPESWLTVANQHGRTPHEARVKVVERLRSHVAADANKATQDSRRLADQARDTKAKADRLWAWLDANPPSREEMEVV